MFKRNNKTNNGITLVALVVSIIVLLILSGTSVTLLAGDNSVLNRISEAKEKTQIAEEDEKDAMELLSSYSNTSVYNRKGIHIGDYIKYTSPTESVKLDKNETGYREDQTLPRKDMFRVLDIDKYGNITLVGAMSSSDKKIYFSGSLGYNNGVYTLNKKCSDLYKNLSRGITARSINLEDIMTRFTQDTINTINSNRQSQFNSSNLYSSSTIVKDSENLTVTFTNENTGCPDIFQYENGGKINGVPTKGKIGQSESYQGYGRITKLKQITPTPTSLTVKYTHVSILYYQITENSFTTQSAVTYDMLFSGRDYGYWLATRSTSCIRNLACYDLQAVYNGTLSGYSITWSYPYESSASYAEPICPIIYIPASVKIDISSNPMNQDNTSGTPHVIK